MSYWLSPTERAKALGIVPHAPLSADEAGEAKNIKTTGVAHRLKPCWATAVPPLSPCRHPN